jgi:hypothetical protein
VLVDAARRDFTLHPGVGLTILTDRSGQRLRPRGVDAKDRVSIFITVVTVSQRLSPNDREGDRGNDRTTNVGVPF